MLQLEVNLFLPALYDFLTWTMHRNFKVPAKAMEGTVTHFNRTRSIISSGMSLIVSWFLYDSKSLVLIKRYSLLAIPG